MSNQNRIKLVFALIVLLLIVQGVLSLNYLDKITTQAENLYKHPYAVSNAARNININLVSMHRYMKDVALAENEDKIRIASNLVDLHEQQVFENFNLIFRRYLGKRSDIEKAYKAFTDWKKIRDEVIILKIKGENKAAADITRNKGAEHVLFLNKETQKLIDFADNKAKNFRNKAIETDKEAFNLIVTLLVAIVIASVFSAFYAVTSLNRAQRDTKSRMHLIDQNILMAKFDKKGVVIDISNHLCRHFGVSKSEIMGQQSSFFLNDKDFDIQAETIFKQASTGKSWEGEIRRFNHQGQLQWIHSVIHPDFDENYEVQGYTNIIHDISARKSIEELSITDTLTGLHNRRYFDEVLDKELKIANRNQHSICLSIIDIDYFKDFNDCYGHPAGDRTLELVADKLKELLQRPNDYVFRLGGEEFGLLFTDLDKEKSFQLLESIRLEIEALKIRHKQSKISDFISISAGAFVSYPGKHLSVAEIYKKADNALYHAKHKRNQVLVDASKPNNVNINRLNTISADKLEDIPV